MNNQQKITEFSHSGEQNDLVKSKDESDEFGWGSFGKPPEDWPVSRVEELFEMQKDSADPDEFDKEELVRLYSMPAFDDNKEPKLTEAGDIGSKKFHVPNQSLLFSKLNISKKRFWLVNHSHNEPALCSTEYWPLLPAEGLNLEFYLQYFNSNSFINRPRLSTSSTTNSHQRIKSNLFSKVRLPVPPLPEQHKIASVLYNVDQAIEKIEELVGQTERVKTGLTQDILKKGITDQPMVETDSRFGLLPESWELRSLNEVGEIAGRTAPEKDDTECWGGDIPWVTPSEITSLVGQKIDSTEEYLTDLALEKVSSNLLPPMSVLMTTRATIGNCAVNTVEMTTNQGFKNIIPGESLDTWYAYYRMDYEKDYLASLSKGSTFPEVGKDTVENFVIPIPPVEEQREIGEILRSVDEQILSYKQNKSQYERLKQGLMQDLLSGKVRTTDTNIQVPDEVAQYG